jgi:ABC-2 type transport system permease protein
MDLDPRQRVAQVNGQMWLENKTDAPIDHVALTIWPADLEPQPRPQINVQELSFAGGRSAVVEDAALRFYVYRLPKPLAPHARIELDFRLRYPNRGFVNSRPNTDIVDNGSFINSSYVPFVGYFQDIELTDDSTRHRHGLEKMKRLAPIGDTAALQNNYVITDSDWIHSNGTISTAPDQIALLPGYLQKEWEQDGRRYFQYGMESPYWGFFPPIPHAMRWSAIIGTTSIWRSTTTPATLSTSTG